MKIKIRPYLTIRKALQDQAVLEMEVDDLTLRALLDELSKRYGSAFQEVIYDAETEGLSPQNQILVNTRHYSFLPHGLDTRLQEGDVVSLIPPLVGG